MFGYTEEMDQRKVLSSSFIGSYEMGLGLKAYQVAPLDASSYLMPNSLSSFIILER
jgi:hypothetical protein